MSLATKPWVTWGLLLLLAAAGRGWHLGAAPAETPTERPARLIQPRTRADRDHCEALKLYALGQMQERDSRLVEAVASYEEALRLDPDSAVLRKAVVPLYLALDRLDDALKTCKEALDLDPGDYDTWFLYARQLKHEGRTLDAIDALRHALACPSLKDVPGLRLQLTYDVGMLLENVQRFQEAAEALTEVVALLDKPEPLVDSGMFTAEELLTQAAETNERLGRIWIRAGQHEKAIAAFRKAQEKDPGRKKRLQFNLAEVYQALGKFDEALASLEAYLTTLPQGTEAYEMKVALLEKLGRSQEILPALHRHSRQDPANQGLKLLLARQCARLGEGAEAEKLFLDLVEQSASPEAYHGLFLLKKEQGQPEKIIELLDAALAGAVGSDDKPADTAAAAKARSMLLVLREDGNLVAAIIPVLARKLNDPDWPAGNGKAELKPDTRRYLAVLAARARQLEVAERLYRSCLQGQAARLHEAEVYSGLIRILWQERKYADIVAVCKKGLDGAQNTSRVLFHLEMSRALGQQGKLDEALAQANEAVDIARDDDRLLVRRNRVLLLAEAERFEEAEKESKALLKEFPAPEEVHEIRYTLSAVYSSAKEYAKSEEQLHMILKSNPDDATAHNDLGYLMADQGKNLEEAEKLIRRALELDRKQKSSGTQVGADAEEDNAAYVDSLGWVLFRRGRLQEARTELERASKMYGGDDDPVVWDHLGDVYFRLGETAWARSAWQKAVELYETARRRQPDDRYKDIKQKLKTLAEATPQ
jgi:tetratricopeptide (TPR) repeat protein